MTQFSEEACGMMINMFDANHSGTIDLSEFGRLFDYIEQWKAIFLSFDRDRSGSIDQAELDQAFQQLGYRLSQTFLQNCLVRADPRTRRITLDKFITITVQMKRLTDSFRARDREGRGQALLNYEDFLGLAMGVHQ